MGFGDYPAEYIPEKHGPYDPARFYGKGEPHRQIYFQKSAKISLKPPICSSLVSPKLHNHSTVFDVTILNYFHPEIQSF